MRFLSSVARFIPRFAWFIAVLTLVIVAHEFGHFLAAKALGYDVKKFSVGWFGPSFASFELWGTPFDFKVGLIGGYNRFDDATWSAMGWGHLTLVLLAGSGLSLLAAFGGLALWRRDRLGHYAKIAKLEAGYPFYQMVKSALSARAGYEDDEEKVRFPPLLSREFVLFMFVSVNAFNLSYFLALLDGGKIVNLVLGEVIGISPRSTWLAMLPAILIFATLAVTMLVSRHYRRKWRELRRRRRQARTDPEEGLDAAGEAP